MLEDKMSGIPIKKLNDSKTLYEYMDSSGLDWMSYRLFTES